MSEKIKPENLIDFPREIKCDDTLEEWNQYLRLQFIVKNDKLDHVQLLLDRRFKLKPKMSKPLGYVHLSTGTQFMDLALMGIVGHVVTLLANRTDVNDILISTTVDSLVQLLLEDAKYLTKLSLELIKKKGFK